ncbi:PP2C family protein-serine/threonine phosphatase [Actinokineospora enzanensis]|uniref:PP2C family protein-serine/threonine phosphatase n=1 Tax=Actinokineospora enzanensis TaxID=155975 RepID=UPI0003614C5D|nr:hypothetical protein [Actinokineospora enzanensis]
MNPWDISMNPWSVTTATASHAGGRQINADAIDVRSTPVGTAVAVVDGIGSSLETCDAALLAASAAVAVGCHRGALVGLLAAADTLPDYPGAPDAVAAVVSLDPQGRLEIAHIGDVAVWLWDSRRGLRRWTVEHTAGAYMRHMLTNPGLTDDERATLEQALAAPIEVMDHYLLGTLGRATVGTVSSTIVREENPELVIITSDGVHKQLPADLMAALVDDFHTDPGLIADALLDSALMRDPEGGDNVTVAVLAIPPTA